jgi:hypothetical protein
LPSAPGVGAQHFDDVKLMGFWPLLVCRGSCLVLWEYSRE